MSPPTWNATTMRERFAVATRAPRPDGGFQSRWARVRGVRIHYRASTGAGGESAPLVLVHGVAVSHRYLMPLAAELAPHRPVRVVDLPGFGLSGSTGAVEDVPALADWLADWMTATGNAPAEVFGNSFGSQVAVDLAMRRPELVRSLVLSGPTMEPGARTMARQALRWLRGAPHEDPGQVPILMRDVLDAGPVRALLTFRLALRDPIERKLPRIEAPTLVTRGELEAVAPQRWAEQVADLLPDAELAVVPGSPHDATYSAPGELAAAVLAFLDRHEGARQE